MVLLIQFRTDQSGWHEIKCVYEVLGLPHNKLSIINAANEKTTTEDIIAAINKADLVLMGGVGESGYESEAGKAKEAFLSAKEKMTPVIKYIAENDTPTLGLCFGHQLLADVLGGTVTKEADLAETGVAEICLTEAGKEDPLLEDMDASFPAVVGHKVSVTTLPDDCVCLAESDKCPIHAFRYNDNVYGFQFHPELDKQTLEDRLKMYPEYRNHAVSSQSNQPIRTDTIIKKAVSIFAK